MKVRICNNDETDYAIYTGETIKEIKEKYKSRLKRPNWENGWCGVIEE